MQSGATIYIVDDDAAVRHSLELMMQSVGLKTKSYSSPQKFLADVDPSRPGCLLLDIRMPEMSGLVLQQELKKQNISIPVIIITGHADVALAVSAMKGGALDFIEKPFHEHMLLDSITRALAHSIDILQAQQERTDFKKLVAQLSAREEEVMFMLVDGKGSKEIAVALGISSKTVDVHRSRIMEKMQVRSVVGLVRLVMAGREKDVSHF